MTTTSRPPGAAASGMIKIQAAIGRASDAVRGMDGSARQVRLAQEMYQLAIVVPVMTITAGAGAVQGNDNMGPGTGDYWSVRRLQIQNFTAGSVLAYRNGEVVGGTLVGTPEVVAPFPQAGVFTFGRGELLLNPNDWLTFTATGITLSAGAPGVFIQGTADRFPVWLLAEYLM